MQADEKLAAFAGAVRGIGSRLPVLGLYLVGSHALGDVRPESDIDFVGVLDRSPDAAEISELAAVHERLGQTLPQPHLDGDWVTAADLGRRAEEAVPALKFISGKPAEASPGAVSPVEWMQLKRRGICLLGPSVAELDVQVDMREVAAYCRRNMVEYWRPQVERLPHLAGVADLQPWIADRVAWIALGIPRLLASIATGDILSKTEAGQYALERFPEWRTVLEASLEQRREPRPERVPELAALAPDAVAFGRRCIEVGLADK